MNRIDGKATAEKLKKEIATEVAAMVASGKRAPHLAAVLVGEDGASLTYVNNKIRSCEQCGIQSTLIRLDTNTTEEALLAKVRELNQQADLDGYIVQLPLPSHIDETKVTLAIDPAKDVDGFHPVNLGRMLLNDPVYLPATPYGILQLLEEYHIETSGKHCVVLGRSHIVGMPVSVLLASKRTPGNCTVTIAHSRTQNLKEVCLQADILIAAIGQPEFVRADMVKEGAVVVDVGTTRVADETKKSGFTLKGDVHFAEVADKASWITPVPGGVGPMTVISLIQNTVLAAKQRKD